MTILDFFDRAVARSPDKQAVVTYSSSGVSRLTYGELEQHVSSIAGNLARLGLGRGSVISYQLPNWWEAIALHLAAVHIGAVSNPLMPFLRERDLRFMLELAETDLLVVPKTFRGFDHEAMAASLKTAVRGLQHVRVVGGGGSEAFEHLLSGPAPASGRATIGDEDIIQYLFTSGTTGEPKCVTHTSRSLLNMVGHAADRLSMSERDIIFMAMPLSHQGGFLAGFLLPVSTGATSVLQDQWEVGAAVDIFASERVTMTLGATPFLADMVDRVSASGTVLPDLRVFLTAGAPIPRALIQRARAAFGARIIPSWGMSENGFVTMATLDSPDDKIFNTDGCAIPGMEVRIADEDGTTLAADEEGRLLVRGPSQFSGYLKRPELSRLEPGDWFDTGDLARMDDDGYIRITGRTKDLVIRGGENIPVIEIEQSLHRHPSISEVAIVGMPDDRLGERVCAFVVTREGASIALAEAIKHLKESEVPKSYWPEHLVCIGEMPRTPTGKIQKFVLRDQAKEISNRLREAI